MAKKLKVGLALGGGGARGLAHIGVLKGFEEAGFPIDLLVGTSIGAVVGAMYAQHPSADYVEDKFRAFLESDEFGRSGMDIFNRSKNGENFFGQMAKRVRERLVINLSITRISIADSKRLEGVIHFLVDPGKFEDTRIPFAAMACDLVTGEGVLFRQGDIQRAVQASASMPGYLPPLVWEDRLLVDGGVVALVPAAKTRQMGADVVIGVDVSQRLTLEDHPNNVIDVIFQANRITMYGFKDTLLADADLVLHPRERNVHWAQFREMNSLIHDGIEETRGRVSEIKHILRKRRGLVERIKALIKARRSQFFP
ncbi:patatin-like phospholipase family protein [candidate division KSB1 bacterium]|nr:patatin-like phospholipase family protein [candidate division KSB1 bacterium]